MEKYTEEINKELRELELCDEGYRSLSPIKKKVKQGKEGKRGKLDCHGRPLEDIQKRDEKKKKEAKDQSDAVATMVAEAITRKHFFLLHTNIFGKIEETGWYVPAEISVVKFSISEGIVKVIQAFPEAGTIPLGYRRLCMETSSRGHMIPYDKKEEEDVQVKSDYLIIEDIEALLAGTDTVVCGMSSSQMTFESQTRMRSAAILASVRLLTPAITGKFGGRMNVFDDSDDEE